MRLVIAAVLFAGSIGCAYAQKTQADPRALEACKAQSGNFVDIADCLPDAHVAVKMLDAFEKLYPPAAAPLKDRCVELNTGNISGAATCVSEAIRSAIGLKASMPEGSSLDDPIFNAVSDEKLETSLLDAEAKAKEDFPDKRIWGGTTYKRYRE